MMKMGDKAMSGRVWLIMTKGYTALSTMRDICIQVPRQVPSRTDKANPRAASARVTGRCVLSSSARLWIRAAAMELGAGTIKAGTAPLRTSHSHSARMKMSSSRNGP
ncbi:hypothetical protein D3C85_1106460 [compost metagenome]